MALWPAHCAQLAIREELSSVTHLCHRLKILWGPIKCRENEAGCPVDLDKEWIFRMQMDTVEESLLREKHALAKAFGPWEDLWPFGRQEMDSEGLGDLS